MISNSGWLDSVLVGFLVAVGNFLLSIGAAWFASTRSAVQAGTITILSMTVRLAVLAVLFWKFSKSGFQLMPLLVSFVITYTISVGVEIALLGKGKE